MHVVQLAQLLSCIISSCFVLKSVSFSLKSISDFTKDMKTSTHLARISSLYGHFQPRCTRIYCELTICSYWRLHLFSIHLTADNIARKVLQKCKCQMKVVTCPSTVIYRGYHMNIMIIMAQRCSTAGHLQWLTALGHYKWAFSWPSENISNKTFWNVNKIIINLINLQT